MTGNYKKYYEVFKKIKIEIDLDEKILRNLLFSLIYYKFLYKYGQIEKGVYCQKIGLLKNGDDIQELFLPEFYDKSNIQINKKFSGNIRILLLEILEKEKLFTDISDLAYFYNMAGSDKKSGGVFYTPEEIIRHMLQKTFEKITFADIENIKILDPACGCGLFFIELVRYFKSKFKMRDILWNKIIYGYDIDRDAIIASKILLRFEVRRLGYGKVNEWNNIKEDDYLIQEEGKFDYIIGNPPYGAKYNVLRSKDLAKKYGVKEETVIFFIHKSLEMINEKGKLSFIVPKTILYAERYKESRDILIEDLSYVTDCGQAWKNVRMEQIVFVYNKQKKSQEYKNYIYFNEKFSRHSIINKNKTKKFGIILNRVTQEEMKIGSKIVNKSRKLCEVVTNRRGRRIAIYSSENKFPVYGGKNIRSFGFVDIPKGYAETVTENIENAVIVQNIISHKMLPIDHIQVKATIIDKLEIFIDETVNILECTDKYNKYIIWGILTSQYFNWYLYKFAIGQAIRTIHFDNPLIKKACIPKFSESDIKIFGKMSKNLYEEYSLAKEKTSRVKDLYDELNEFLFKHYKLEEKEVKIINEINYL